MKFTRRLLSGKNQKGMAIVWAVFCVVMVSYIVTEISYETNIEYAIHAQSVNRIKAYYAARSGIELSLLRVKLYRKIQKQFGSQLGSNAGMLNLIWSFPLNWPPVLPEAASAVDKDNVQDKVKEAKLDSTFVATITDEGSKIDLNDLDSPSKVLRESTKKQLLKIFESKTQNDPDWARDHSDLRPEELVNNIADWEDADKTSLNGGDEVQFYKNPPQELWPPNRAFRSIEELRLVAGMTDELFDLLAPRVTVYGAKAINPNTASREVLQSLDPSMTDQVINEVMQRRDNPQNGGFFTSADDFWGFVNSKGARVPNDVQMEVPLIFDAVTNFRIQSVGEYHGAVRQIEAVVFDVTEAANVVAEKVKKENPNPNDPSQGGNPATPPGPGGRPGQPGRPPNQPAANQTPSKGPPRIVYWFEK
jgi:general secretion pathway protein K